MLILLSVVFSMLCSMFRSRAALELEHIALRHQIGVLKRSARKRPKLTAADRLFWVFLSRVWEHWRSALDIVKPATAIAWHRKGFRLFWTWKIRHGRVGRPAVSCEVRDQMTDCPARQIAVHTEYDFSPTTRRYRVDSRLAGTDIGATRPPVGGISSCSRRLIFL